VQVSFLCLIHGQTFSLYIIYKKLAFLIYFLGGNTYAWTWYKFTLLCLPFEKLYIAVQLGKVCSFLSWHLELGTPGELSKYCPVPEIYRETLSWKQL